MRRNVKTNYYYYRSIDPSFYVRTFKSSELYSIPLHFHLFSHNFSQRGALKNRLRVACICICIYVDLAPPPSPRARRIHPKKRKKKKGTEGGEANGPCTTGVYTQHEGKKANEIIINKGEQKGNNVAGEGVDEEG